MNKNKVYEFYGKITSKKLDKVYNKTSPYYNKEFWRLKVDTNEPEIKTILVITKYLEDKSLFTELERWENYQQNYLLYCHRKPGAGQIYRLINWKELSNHE